MVRDNWFRDVLSCYELLEESDNIYELNTNIKYYIEAIHTAACDICSDRGWDCSDIEE